MSTATDEHTHTDDEVPEIEPEQTGDEIEPGDEPEPEPEPDEPEAAAPQPGAATEADYAEVFDKALRRAKTYMAAVPTILGDSAADLSYCPRCGDFLPGFVLPLAIKPVSDEQRVAVYQSIGEAVEPQLLQAADATVCPACEGWGKVKTGSHKPTEATAPCLDCNGRGWIGPRVQRIEQLTPAAVAVIASAGETLHEPSPPTDPWGRVKGVDPLYGVMPGYEPE